jgi:hypothetical protein
MTNNNKDIGRVAELEYQQRVLHQIIDRNNDNPDVQIKAVIEK